MHTMMMTKTVKDADDDVDDANNDHDAGDDDDGGSWCQKLGGC